LCQLLAAGRAAGGTTLQKEAGHGLLSCIHVPLSNAAAVPEAITASQSKSAAANYTKAAQSTIRVCFDGIEIHGVNAYLLDRFLQDTCNCRNDEYGGSVENCAQFPIEVANSIPNVIGTGKTWLQNQFLEQLPGYVDVPHRTTILVPS